MYLMRLIKNQIESEKPNSIAARFVRTDYFVVDAYTFRILICNTFSVSI